MRCTKVSAGVLFALFAVASASNPEFASAEAESPVTGSPVTGSPVAGSPVAGSAEQAVSETRVTSAVEVETDTFGSPKRSLDELNRESSGSIVTEGEQSVLRKIVFYIPNRLIDLVDIFRIDVGIGGSIGGVARVTRYGQFGYRFVEPLSLRAGIVGREFPLFIERTTESGFGSDFNQSPERFVTPFELGLGLDCGVAAYVGLSFDEFIDFLAGFILIDIKRDDLGS